MAEIHKYAEIHEYVADVLESYYRMQGDPALSILRQEVYDIAGRTRKHNAFLQDVKAAVWDRHRLIVLLEGGEPIGLVKAQAIKDLPAVTAATQVGVLNEVRPHGMKPFLRRSVWHRAPRLPRAK